MKPVTFKDAAKAVGSSSNLDGSFSVVSTDTRKIENGCLFIALKGEKFDSNEFAALAIEKGAAAVICDRDCGLGDRQIIVDDGRKALLDLAGWYRGLFDIPVVGVTGSVGKTTTKEMIYYTLSSKYKTLKNEGNLNNEIGVPLTLLRLDDTYEAAVIEMGMSAFGEISRLTGIVKPSISVISNIGVSHMENLGSREGILKAKLEILEGMNLGSPLIINADNDMLSTVKETVYPITRFGVETNQCDYYADGIAFSDEETIFTVTYGNGLTREVSIPATGRHNIYNALTAMAVGEKLGINIDEAIEALQNYIPAGMRQKIVKKAEMTFIEDCYNASPDSQKAALSVLGQLTGKRKIAVIGDMLELGEISEKAHYNVGLLAGENKVDAVFAYGDAAQFMYEGAKNSGVKDCFYYSDKCSLTKKLISYLAEGDVILFKASRAMKLEEIIEEVYKAL